MHVCILQDHGSFAASHSKICLLGLCNISKILIIYGLNYMALQMFFYLFLNRNNNIKKTWSKPMCMCFHDIENIMHLANLSWIYCKYLPAEMKISWCRLTLITKENKGQHESAAPDWHIRATAPWILILSVRRVQYVLQASGNTTLCGT